MKKSLLFSALLTLSSVSCFADALLFAVKSTPYDRQMTRIEPILTSNPKTADNNVSMTVVNAWMSDLRSIPYGFTTVWKTPAEAQSGAPADCKAKAVALYEKMKAHGASGVRLVIGRRTMTSRQTHTWLSWETPAGSFVLDPTFNYEACKAERLGSRSYMPLYAYSGHQKYRAASSPLVAQN